MDNFQKIYDGIGNESFSKLLNGVKDDPDYKETSEYDVMVRDLLNLISTIPDKNLRDSIENVVFDFTSIAERQGFVLGFKEAVRLLTA
jgi:hypothetical protein